MPSTKVPKPPASALWTVLPVLALALGELWTLVNRTPGDTLSEVVWWSAGDKASLRYAIATGFVAGWLVWLGLHWLVSRAVWGGPQLVVLLVGFMATAAAVWLTLPK